MTAPEQGGNYYGTRRHYAATLTPEPRDRGRSGEALCSSEANPVTVYDQQWHDSWDLSKPKKVADLPLCKKCEKRAAKIAGVSL